MLKQTVVIMKLMAFFETHFNQVGFYRKGAKYAKNSVLFIRFNTRPFYASLAKRAVLSVK
jgi:hypothetical protein